MRFLSCVAACALAGALPAHCRNPEPCGLARRSGTGARPDGSIGTLGGGDPRIECFHCAKWARCCQNAMM